MTRITSAHSDPAESFDLHAFFEQLAPASPEDLLQVCACVRILAVSGVEVPWRTLRFLAGQTHAAELQSRLNIATAVHSSVCPVDPAELAEVCATLLDSCVKEVESPGLSDMVDLKYMPSLLCLTQALTFQNAIPEIDQASHPSCVCGGRCGYLGHCISRRLRQDGRRL